MALLPSALRLLKPCHLKMVFGRYVRRFVLQQLFIN